jgi:hypothetical protein
VLVGSPFFILESFGYRHAYKSRSGDAHWLGRSIHPTHLVGVNPHVDGHFGSGGTDPIKCIPIDGPRRLRRRAIPDMSV